MVTCICAVVVGLVAGKILYAIADAASDTDYQRKLIIWSFVVGCALAIFAENMLRLSAD